MGLVPADCFGNWKTHAEGRERAEKLYEELRDHRIVYANEPWNPAYFDERTQLAYQRVRGPNETVQGPATCLDLALVFAGMAVSADMRPFIGIRTGGLPHALVVLDVGTPLATRAKRKAGPPGFTERPGEPGVLDKARDDAPSGARDKWLIVDVSQAARRSLRSAADRSLPAQGVPFDVAADQDVWWQEFGSDTWTLVDVDRVMRDSESYTPPAGRSIPAIHGYLPALPKFTDYRTRRGLLEELHGMVAPAQPHTAVVLHGPSGRGKSMLAHRLAVAADHGCGWFLNATDDKVLMRSLAQAERQEKVLRGEQLGQGDSGEKPDPDEDRALASAALSRLREADQPWVVVLDNCDGAPDNTRVVDLIPRPRRSGQFVIITTTNPDWARYAQRNGWQTRELLPLALSDLEDLGLPGGVADAVDGRPLVAQALVALRDQDDVELPERAGTDGPGLVWDALRASLGNEPEAIALARLLAWHPPEPADLASLLATAGCENMPLAGSALADRRFVTSSYAKVRPAVQMHRLFAAAVRDQTWRDAPATAADVITRLLTDENGRRSFIDAADSTALGRLESGKRAGEAGETARAAELITDTGRKGLLWYGLGHIRERRGPVSESAPHFTRAVAGLDRGSHPFEVAESLIGQARIVFQNSRSTTEELSEAQGTVELARRLLEPLDRIDNPQARQMREQGNALNWLIARKFADRIRKPQEREIQLREVRENLWLSYERRLHIAHEQAQAGRNVPDGRQAGRENPPEAADGLGAERAYYNLAGVNIQLAKTHNELARKLELGIGETAREKRDAMYREVKRDLEEAAQVYEVVRVLRELRYGGRPHPHLASCVHGQALIAYFRAVLLGEKGKLAEAFGFAAEAMEQRRKVAAGLVGPGSAAVLSDGDVRKSINFMIKVGAASAVAGYDRPSEGVGAALGAVQEAMAECLSLTNWIGPSDG
jgi:hypothetical protein